MKRANALQVRQSLGRILEQLDESGEPILVEKGRQPRAVLVPIKMFRERFVDKTVHAERLELERRIEELGRRSGVRAGPSSEELLRALRGSLP